MCQGSVARSSGSGSLDTGCTHVSSGRRCGEAREGDTQGVLRPATREQGAAWSLGVTEAAGASEGRLLPWPPARGAVLIRQKKAGRKVRQYPPILTCPYFSLLPRRKGLTCSMHWISWRTKPSWRSSSSALGMATYSITCTIGSAPAWGRRRYVRSGQRPHRTSWQLGQGQVLASVIEAGPRVWDPASVWALEESPPSGGHVSRGSVPLSAAGVRVAEGTRPLSHTEVGRLFPASPPSW